MQRYEKWLQKYSARFRRERKNSCNSKAADATEKIKSIKIYIYIQIEFKKTERVTIFVNKKYKKTLINMQNKHYIQIILEHEIRKNRCC